MVYLLTVLSSSVICAFGLSNTCHKNGKIALSDLLFNTVI